MRLTEAMVPKRKTSRSVATRASAIAALQTSSTRVGARPKAVHRPSRPSHMGRPGGGRGGAHISRGGGGRGGFSRGGGGRRSDIRLKEDVSPLMRLGNGLELYRFRYKGSDDTFYVGVMAQEVQTIDPSAVSRDRDGFLIVDSTSAWRLTLGNSGWSGLQTEGVTMAIEASRLLPVATFFAFAERYRARR